MNKKTFALLCLLFGIAFSYFLAHTFQHPVYVSKRLLALSAAIGLVCAAGLFIAMQKQAEKYSLAPARFRQHALVAAVLSIAFFALVGYQPATLLAPRVEIRLEFQAAPSAPVPLARLSGVSDGERYLSLKDTITPEKPAAAVSNNSLPIQLDENGRAELVFRARTWGSRIHFFFEEATSDFSIEFDSKTIKETFQYPVQPGTADLSTSAQTPPVPVLRALSLVLFFCSLFCSLLLSAFFMECWQSQNGQIKPGVTLAIQLIFAAAAVLAALYPYSPKYLVQTIDSYLFHFFGKSMLEGKIPYRDLWDHKGPVIFFLNALGHSFQQGMWGVWWIELAFAFLCVIIFLKMFWERLGALTLILAVLFLNGLTRRFQGGNLTEEYALLFYMLAFYAFWHFLRQPRKTWLLVLIGVAAGLSFMLRANLISPFVAIGIVLILEGIQQRQFKATVKYLALVLAGFSAVSVGFILYFAAHGALFDFFNAAFFYNFLYTQKSALPLVRKISFVVEIFPMYMLLLAGCFAILCYVMQQKDGSASRLEKRFFTVFAIGYALEMLVYNLSGNNYFHYMVPLVPYEIFCFTLFTALVLEARLKRSMVWQILSGSSVYAIALIFAFGFLGNLHSNTLKPAASQSNIYEQLRSQLQPNKSLLMWGYGLDFHYELDIDSPTRYIPLHLTNCAFVTESMIQELVISIVSKQPVIVDMKKLGPGYALEPGLRATEESCPPFEQFFTYFDKHYLKSGQLSNGYEVYQPITDH